MLLHEKINNHNGRHRNRQTCHHQMIIDAAVPEIPSTQAGSGIKDLSFKSSIAKIYSFQTLNELKITMTAIAGRAKGSATHDAKSQVLNSHQYELHLPDPAAFYHQKKKVFSKRILSDNPTLIIQRMYP